MLPTTSNDRGGIRDSKRLATQPACSFSRWQPLADRPQRDSPVQASWPTCAS